MGSCYSSQGKNHIEEALEPSNGSITTTTTTTSTISPSLSSRLVSGRWKNKSKSKKKRRKSRDAYRKTGSVDFSFLGKIGGGGGTATDERELHSIPGTMFINGASDAACLYTQQGRKGPNQDAMLVWENFSSRSDTIFCGVFDGHGPYGHMVAKKVRDALPLKLCTQLKANFGSDQNHLYQNTSAPGSMDSEETTSIGIDDEWCEPLEVDENEKYPEIYVPLKHSLLKAFKLMDKELKLHPTIDCFCSGTTAVTLIKQGQDLIIGNVGDSRAVLGTRDKDHSLVAIQLTVDLKPNLPREAARIHQCKGRVFALQDEPEVTRVWLPNSDSPGLAMARAFGDFCLKDFGLISVPDVSYHCLSERDEFVVLATDGVWDVLSNKEVVDIIASAPNRATAARALVDCAVRAWRLKFPTSKSDDCAAVCLFLDHLSTHGPSRMEENALVKETGEVEPIVTNMTEGEKQCTNMHGLEVDAALVHGPILDHLVTLKGSDEIVPITESIDRKLPERCQSTRSLAECISTAEDEEWSALEGVTRVNSLLNLPRFLSNDKRAPSRRKWF